MPRARVSGNGEEGMGAVQNVRTNKVLKAPQSRNTRDFHVTRGLAFHNASRAVQAFEPNCAFAETARVRMHPDSAMAKTPVGVPDLMKLNALCDLIAPDSRHVRASLVDQGASQRSV